MFGFGNKWKSGEKSNHRILFTNLMHTPMHTNTHTRPRTQKYANTFGHRHKYFTRATVRILNLLNSPHKHAANTMARRQCHQFVTAQIGKLMRWWGINPWLGVENNPKGQWKYIPRLEKAIFKINKFSFLVHLLFASLFYQIKRSSVWETKSFKLLLILLIYLITLLKHKVLRKFFQKPTEVFSPWFLLFYELHLFPF